MSKNFAVELVKKNWYLIAAFVVIMGGAGYMSGGSDSSGADAVVDSNATAAVPRGLSQTATSNSAATAAGPWKGLSKQDKARDSIREYHEKFAKNPDKAKSAADLSNLGNLHYSKLGEYTQAAAYYEQLLKNYPNWKGNNVAYPNLASCYERLNEKKLAKYTYERMLAYFDSDTQHYLFAKQKLGR